MSSEIVNKPWFPPYPEKGLNLAMFRELESRTDEMLKGMRERNTPQSLLNANTVETLVGRVNYLQKQLDQLKEANQFNEVLRIEDLREEYKASNSRVESLVLGELIGGIAGGVFACLAETSARVGMFVVFSGAFLGMFLGDTIYHAERKMQLSRQKAT